MLRIILDTNVLIEGAKDPHSFPVRIMRLVISGELVPLVSDKTQKEHDKIIDRLMVNEDYLSLVKNFFDQTENVETTSRLRGITEDRDDDKFVELAKDGDADYIITDDHHLLDLKRYGNTEIMTPEQFWNAYHEVDRTAARAIGY